ncbi:trafficking protein particle complex subunit 6B-like [Populus alba x Populus x berolinensis]|nr:trafficking protein particle complex subunit 6B-like [Populus alba x Populus x berolinensis]
MGREVSKSCMDGLVTEMVSSYCTRFYANKPELAARRIEAIGYQVGHQLSERYGSPSFTPYQTPHYLFHCILADSILGLIRYTIERPRFTDHLEAIKFICKDFWSELFKKQIDNLKTNHRGTFVLQDNKFPWLSRMSGNDLSVENGMEDPESKGAQAMNMYCYFPCGIIRGALSNLGIPCAVSADISSLPACSFVISVKA